MTEQGSSEQRPLVFWLELVHRMLDAQFETTLDEHGVTRRQWQLLNVLATEPSDLLQAGDETAYLDDVGELIESDWVHSDGGARPQGSVYSLTERGRGAFDRLSAVIAEQRTNDARGISPDDYLTSVSALRQLATNLGWSDS
jgi:DNA-binding MarR family transcriptional regulator